MLAAALAGVAQAKRPPPPPRPAAPAPARRIDVRVVKHGDLARLIVEGGVLELRTTVEAPPRRRTLTAAEGAELLAAARAAEKNDDGRRSCGGDEPFVELTIDGKTTSTAVCPPGRFPGDYYTPWRALVAEVVQLAAVSAQ